MLKANLSQPEMLTPKYKPGDMVRIVDWPWSQYAGEIVIITKAEVMSLDGEEFVSYEWKINRHGGGAEKWIDEYITHIDGWKNVVGE
jgi:hypothetical protein